MTGEYTKTCVCVHACISVCVRACVRANALTYARDASHTAPASHIDWSKMKFFLLQTCVISIFSVLLFFLITNYPV